VLLPRPVPILPFVAMVDRAEHRESLPAQALVFRFLPVLGCASFFGSHLHPHILVAGVPMIPLLLRVLVLVALVPVTYFLLRSVPRLLENRVCPGPPMVARAWTSPKRVYAQCLPLAASSHPQFL
jgi:hypothetical protein